MTARLTTRLRSRVMEDSRILLLPGAPNALLARVLEDSGCEAIYVSGAGVSNSFLGFPDSGFLTVTELAQHVAAIREAVAVPLVVDADTGFGNALNVWRSVRTLEGAGANAIQIEDQSTPKRCGHFDGKAIITSSEMVGKIHAATDARDDDDLLLVARTDARAELGLSEACDRANSYREAGADVVFIEAPHDGAELRAIPRLAKGPLLVNMVEGGRTPLMGLDELNRLGYSIVLYANSAMRGAISGAQRITEHLLSHGDTRAIEGEMVAWDERQRLVRKDHFDRMDSRYGEFEAGWPPHPSPNEDTSV